MRNFIYSLFFVLVFLLPGCPRREEGDTNDEIAEDPSVTEGSSSTESSEK